MNIPVDLNQAINSLIIDKDSTKIRNDTANICSRYQNESGKGKRLVRTYDEVIAYVVARMPATYSAVYKVLEYMCEVYAEPINSLLDFGSGTGAVSWAANDFFLLKSVVCVEREKYMIDVAKKLMISSNINIKNIKWINESITAKVSLEKKDLVTVAYVMNELEENEKQLFLEKLWDNANKVIAIIEPGTHVGYRNIMNARDYFISKGAKVIAPCTHESDCKLEKGDWCHFSCRLSRNKLQKFVKSGDAPYEDEKFSYIVVSKNNIENKKVYRIIRHPIISKGHIKLKTCSIEGINNLEITKKNKELYKAIKKVNWGDMVIINDNSEDEIQ